MLTSTSPTVLALPSDPAGLDEWLSEAEQAVDGITPGTEKTIDWFAEPGQKTPLAIVYLHGFSATRQETAPLANNLAQQLGANVFHARLAGHGRPGEALGRVELDDWLADTEQAYRIGRLLGEQVILLSVSTGSTLSTWLATQPFVDLAAMVMVSPNFELADPGTDRIDWPLGIGVLLAEWTVGKERAWEPVNELHGHYWTNRYPTRALRPLVQLIKQVRKIDKAAIAVPTLMIYSPEDKVVSVPAIQSVFEQFGAKHKQLVPFRAAEDPYQHVIAGDILSPTATAKIQSLVIDFLSAVEAIAEP